MKSQRSNRSQNCQEQRSGSRARAVELKFQGITPRMFENTQDVLWSRDITCHRLDETLPGFYISWEDCHMFPGIDYVRYQFMGRLMPLISEFDGVCKLCSKKGSVRIRESSGTETSSSTSQGEI